MRNIVRYWELQDFCRTHGRVIPTNVNSENKFSSFYCADKSHDDSEIVDFSAEQGSAENSMVGVLLMRGFVVEFEGDGHLLFCTKEELDVMLEKQKEEEKKGNAISSIQPKDNPARPRGLKITRNDMVIEYKAYERCTEYPIRLRDAQDSGLLTPPFMFGDNSFRRLLCKEDCIFCHCPFYDVKLFEELRHNHREDYNEWVMDYFKEVFKK